MEAVWGIWEVLSCLPIVQQTLRDSKPHRWFPKFEGVRSVQLKLYGHFSAISYCNCLGRNAAQTATPPPLLGYWPIAPLHTKEAQNESADRS